MHDDNKSNNGQIGQVVAMGGSEKTQDSFFKKIGCQCNGGVCMNLMPSSY